MPSRAIIAMVSTHFWRARSRYFQEVDLEIIANLYALLASGFPSDRSQPAIETPDQVYSWNDIEEMSARLASLLQALNLPVGARVAVQVEKSPTALMLYLATVRAGLVYLPLNTDRKSTRLNYSP